MIRKATIDDANRLLEIYSYYVEKTAISFDVNVPSLKEFQDRINNIKKEYPYLVIEDNGIIYGYAYARPFVGREAYKHSCETTIYLDNNSKGKGYGKQLYQALEESLKDMGILNMYACIGDPIVEDEYLTRNSEKFHEHMGFKKVGIFQKCGFKFGCYYNMIWMEKIIGNHN